MIRNTAFIIALMHSAAMFGNGSYAMRSGGSVSDSIDLIHTTINLNVTDYTGHTIHGSAEVHLQAKVNGIAVVPFDLLLPADSIVCGGVDCAFTQSGGSLEVMLPSVMNAGDSTVLTVYYGGIPTQDASWGGWYWSGDYAYQLGVGFDAIPHNFGRVWFPCFDNFKERETFTTIITTSSDKKAFCGGLLQSSTDNGDGTVTWTWNLGEPIPSYLESVAVSTYSTVHMTFPGMERDIPVMLGVKAADSTHMKNTFTHLFDALHAFENDYGPYAWDRVGYVVVPFSGGAMEHATNIAFPLFGVTGDLTYETIMAHELSHHWWGDLVTCSSAGDMWINEGWATYSEDLFTEWVYGETAYQDAVKENHLNVLHYAAAYDGGNYFALSGMPEAYTYGYTTYQKGADVIHTLRGYLGDETFFSAIKAFLSAYAFQPVSAEDFMNFLSSFTGIDMHPFFNGWIFQGGFPGFEIEHVQKNDAGAITGVCLQQKTDHAPDLFQSVPLTLTFLDNAWQVVHTENIVMSGESASFSFAPQPATHVEIDYNEKISDATTDDMEWVHGTGTYTMQDALFNFTVNSISDSAFLRVEHHWTAADNFRVPVHGLHVSPDRYWKVEGTFPAGFEASAELLYNGTASFSGGYLDNTLISNPEDSLVLLYRPDEDSDWTVYPYYTINFWSNHNDKRGAFELSTIEAGEYCFAIYDHSIPDEPAYISPGCNVLPAEEGAVPDNGIRIFPNPAGSSITVHIPADMFTGQMDIYSAKGSKCESLQVSQGDLVVNTLSYPDGIYYLQFLNGNALPAASEKLVIIH